MLKPIALQFAVHRGANDDVVSAITINVTRCQTVAKVRSDLGTTDVLDVLKLPCVQDHLESKVVVELETLEMLLCLKSSVLTLKINFYNCLEVVRFIKIIFLV